MGSSLIGQVVKRREDPRLITGHGSYTNDVGIPGLLHVAFVRSPYASARILSIDSEAARHAPGVQTIITGKDVAGLNTFSGGMRPPTAKNVVSKHVLPTDKVYYVGEPVAVVVATDPYLAKDAADLVEVDWEPLPAVADPVKALEDGAPLVFPEVGSNVAFTLKNGSDEVEAALAGSDVTVTVRVVNNRVAAMPIEGRAIMADYDPLTDGLVITYATQQLHGSRSEFANLVGLPDSKVRVISRDVGGAFGAKLTPYPEDAAVAYLAWTLKKPVSWADTRSENLKTMTQGRGHITEITIGAKLDGTFTALDTKAIADIGGWLHPLGAATPSSIMGMAPGPYKFPIARAQATGVYTNCAPTGPYRGAGRPEATYALERAVDAVARKLNMDPVALRRKNLIEANAFPFKTSTNQTYDSGNYQQALDMALKAIDYDHWRAEQKTAREQGRYIGIGVTTFVEPSGMGPGEFSEVRVERSGKVTVLSGAAPNGQGHHTILAQIVASEFDIPIENVEVITGDTAAVAMSGGTFGSRTGIMAGNAAGKAAREVKTKMTKIAAGMLEASSDDIQLEDGQFHVKGDKTKSVPFERVAGAGYSGMGVPTDMEPGLISQTTFRMGGVAYPFGTHIAIVEVDAKTGVLTVLRYLGIDDLGTLLNPALVLGQLQGGFAQGYGEAFMEQMVYDEDGQLLSGSLMDYAMPRSNQVPTVEFQFAYTPSPLNPLGAKGVGEAGCIAAPPTLVNAAIDALSPLGVTHLDMPLSAPRVWAAIQAAQGAK